MTRLPDDVAGLQRKERLFVAVELSDELKARLLDARRHFPGLKWTPVANLHLTLRFIGQVPQDLIAPIRQALSRVVFDAFRLTVAGLGLFQRRTSGILWAGVQKAPALGELRRQADEALRASVGLSPDEKEYSPHVTLSRLRGLVSQPLKNLVRENAAEHFGAMDVTEFTLFRSLPRPSGAIHEPVEKYRTCP